MFLGVTPSRRHGGTAHGDTIRTHRTTAAGTRTEAETPGTDPAMAAAAAPAETMTGGPRTGETTLVRQKCGTGHTYKLDGKKVSGVTTIIGEGFPAPGLIGWTGKVVAEFIADADDDEIAALRMLRRADMIGALRRKPTEQRNKAAVRGTRVHGFAEHLSRGEQLVCGEGAGEVPPDLEGHVESCVRFLDEWQAAPVLTETVVGNSWVPYAGTLDLIADIPGHGRVLLDYKTGDSGIWPETALQLAAYRFADFFIGTDGTQVPMVEVGIEATWAVHLRADGYDVKPINTGTERKTSIPFQMFRAAAYIAERVDAIKSTIGDALEPPQRKAA